MQTVIIKIRGAGIFGNPHHSGTTDFVFDDDSRLTGERKKRSGAPYLKVTSGKLAINFVANLLRVLCGERPVPSIRKVRFSGDPIYENLARKSRFIINKGECSPPIKYGKRSKGETLTSRKAIGGLLGTGPFSTTIRDYYLDGKWVSIKGGLIYWDRLHRFLGDELFKNFIAVASQILGKDARAEFTAQQCIEFMNTHKSETHVKDLCNKLIMGKRKPMVNVIMNQNIVSFTLHSEITRPLNALMVCSGVEQINKFDCEIYVPVSDEELKDFSKGTGVATFLEGGIACINRIEDWSELVEIFTEPTIEGELCILQK